MGSAAAAAMPFLVALPGPASGRDIQYPLLPPPPLPRAPIPALLPAPQGVNVTALREVKLLRELASPDIVRLLDVFPHKRGISLVFEFCESDLEVVIKDRSIVLSAADIKAYMQVGGGGWGREPWWGMAAHGGLAGNAVVTAELVEACMMVGQGRKKQSKATGRGGLLLGAPARTVALPCPGLRRRRWCCAPWTSATSAGWSTATSSQTTS